MIRSQVLYYVLPVATENSFLHLAAYLGSSKIINLGPGLDWGWIRPLAVSNSAIRGTHFKCSAV